MIIKNKCMTMGPDGSLSGWILLNAKSGMRMMDVSMGNKIRVTQFPLALDHLKPPNWDLVKPASGAGDLGLMVYEAVLGVDLGPTGHAVTLERPDIDAPPSALVLVPHANYRIAVPRPREAPRCFCPEYKGAVERESFDVGVPAMPAGWSLVSLDETRPWFAAWVPTEHDPIVVAFRLVYGEPKLYSLNWHDYDRLGREHAQAGDLDRIAISAV